MAEFNYKNACLYVQSAKRDEIKILHVRVYIIQHYQRSQYHYSILIIYTIKQFRGKRFPEVSQLVSNFHGDCCVIGPALKFHIRLSRDEARVGLFGQIVNRECAPRMNIKYLFSGELF